jgi:hypothetical protein
VRPGQDKKFSLEAGLLIDTDAPSNATSKIKEQEKIFPSSKKVASRQDE